MSETESTPKPSFLRRWMRRLGRVAIFLFALLLIARATHSFWLPPVVDGAAASGDLALVYRDLDLSVTGGRIDLWGVEVWPRDAMASGDEADAGPESGDTRTTPLARLAYLGVDVDVSALLTGTLRVHRVELDGVELALERDGHGEWNFERHLEAFVPAGGDDATTSTSSEDGADHDAEDSDGDTAATGGPQESREERCDELGELFRRFETARARGRKGIGGEVGRPSTIRRGGLGGQQHGSTEKSSAQDRLGKR